MKIFRKMGVVFSVIFLFVSTAIGLASSPQKASVFSIQQTMNPVSHSSTEIELKYYMEEGLSTVVGACTTSVWKTAIRLTQDEMAAYSDWTMTKVNVAFSANGCPYMYVRIYIYEKGNTPTRPGPVIVNDTIAKLVTTGVTTVPLVTPVNLSGHEELWVAVEWNDTWEGPGVYYAVLDTLTGPHVPQKGDFYYLNNAWGEIYTGGADYDGNWGIGAIIEGSGFAGLSIGDFKGPFGVTANVSNIGEVDAENISWSILVTGGLLHRINVMETGTASSLLAGSSITISTGMFFGVGKILITVTAVAENALEVMATKTAFLLGPFVFRIK